MGLEDKLPNGILLTNLERFVNYSRGISIWSEAFDSFPVSA
jgi:NADH-quinone oxidoreductase subunit B